MKKILLTGGSGLVGSRLKELLEPGYKVLVPTHETLDITDRRAVREFFKISHPDAVVHAAAFTDVKEAERERGDKNGLAWRVNVDGTRNIDQAAKQVRAYHIFISTGSVFSSTGPFSEDNKPGELSKLSWYAQTKRLAELEVHGAIIRISHPLYIQRLKASKVFIKNQRFPLTSISDLARAIKILISKTRPGIYHVASPDFVSPYKLMSLYTGKSIKGSQSQQQYPALSVTKTQKILGLRFKHWKEVVREELPPRRRVADEATTNSSRG